MYQRTMATIIAHRSMAPGYQRMDLACSADYRAARPGQFVMISVRGEQTLLRRPFSIHRLTIGRGNQTVLAILYKIVGAGTAALSRLKPGEQLDILGPLGQGFKVRDGYRRIYIAAGGIGVAPMVYLAEYLIHMHDLVACEVFIGGRTREDLLCIEEFKRLGVKVHRTTDDGSDGAQCFLTHPLELEAQKQLPDIIYACGPTNMLSCVAGIAEGLKIPCQVSIEAAMACGVGACLGCAVSPRSGEGYLHVCKDGPVFDIEQMQW